MDDQNICARDKIGLWKDEQFSTDAEEIKEKKQLENFQLLYLISNWVEPETTTKRLTVEILLPPSAPPGTESVF